MGGSERDPVRRFAKGENKEQIARPLIDTAERDGGDGRVVLIGIAQEKTPVRRSCKAKCQEHAAHPNMEWGRQIAFVNHFYFYLWDPERGGASGNQRLRPVAGVAVAQRPHLGADSASGSVSDMPHGQRIPQPRRSRSAAADLRPARAGRGEELLLAVAAAATVPRSPGRTCARDTSTSWRSGSSRSPTLGGSPSKNWTALRAVGESANQLLCDAQAADARSAPDVATFAEVTRPSTIDGPHAPALPFGDPRVMAVLAAIIGFSHLLAGFDNPPSSESSTR
jgi:hypothetical protein